MSWDLSKTQTWFPTKFKIWYADGSEFIGRTMADWQRCPDEGVVYIFEYNSMLNVGRYNSASDWYWIHPDKGVGCSNSSTWEVDVWEELNLPEGCGNPKKGKWTTDKHMLEVSDEAKVLARASLRIGEEWQ